MTRQDLIDVVQGIPYPEKEKEVYFEYSSADGFAFLGAAKENLGLNYTDEYKVIVDREFRLNGENKIAGHAISANAAYVYTMWTCCEFLLRTSNLPMVRKLESVVSAIGTYQSGWQRYCNEECYLIVPNVTSAAALIKAMVGNQDEAEEMVEFLRRHQCSNGNWNYFTLDKHLNMARRGQEDIYHVAMMIYHLNRIEELCGVFTGDIIKKAVRLLKPHPGSIGWGYPMELLALYGFTGEIDPVLLGHTIGCLQHSNFRTRGLAAFALSEVLNG